MSTRMEDVMHRTPRTCSSAAKAIDAMQACRQCASAARWVFCTCGPGFATQSLEASASDPVISVLPFFSDAHSDLLSTPW